MAKRIDPLKAKEKKQKMIAAVGGVLLLGILAFEGPKVLKQLHKKPIAAGPAVATTATSTTPGSPTSLAPPSLQGANQSPSTGPTGGTQLSGSPTQAAQEGQLTSFSRFASKDPFAQQLSTGGSPSSSTPAKSPPSSKAPSSGSSTPSGSGSQPAPGSAVISVNGTLMTVTVGTDFPQASASAPSAQPFFHLVSVSAHTAKVSIVGGSYTTGAATVTLRENKPVTLLNTADGTRYKLILKPQGTPVGASSSSSSGTTTTTTTTTTTPGG